MKTIIRNKFPPIFFIFLFLSGLYLFTRLYNVTILPIFNDESWSIYWSRLIANTNAHWLISLVDGKPPLFFWIMAMFFKVLPLQPYLFVGRLPSVLFGFISLLAIYFISSLLFNSKRIAFFACLFYILSPFPLMYDRQALYDSLLNAMLLWTIYFALRTSYTLRFSDALFWGFFLGLSLYSKPSANIFVVLTPIIFLLYCRCESVWKRKGLLLLIAVLIGESIHYSLLLSHGYHDYVTVNQRYTPSVPFLITHPFMLFSQNFPLLISWVIEYSTFSLFLLGCIAFVVLLKNHPRQGLILFIPFFIPLLLFAFVGQILFPRYILFITPYFFITAAYGIDVFMKKAKYIVLTGCIVLLFPALLFDFFLLTDPVHAPFPEIERYQFVSGVPSGYGFQKIFQFLNKKQQKNPITLITLGTISSYPYTFNLEYWDNKNINIVPIWPVTASTKQKIQQLKKQRKTYIVMKFKSYTNHKNFLTELGLRIVLSAEKPGNKNPIYLAEPVN